MTRGPHSTVEGPLLSLTRYPLTCMQSGIWGPRCAVREGLVSGVWRRVFECQCGRRIDREQQLILAASRRTGAMTVLSPIHEEKGWGSWVTLLPAQGRPCEYDLRGRPPVLKVDFPA